MIGVRYRGEQLRLEVWDSGIGMPQDQLQLIFQEFYQVTNPERNAEKGLGLGLSIVARLAERLHHPVDVRSSLGRGSVFGITLPAAIPAPESESAEQSHHSKDYEQLNKLNKTVAILGKPPEKSDEPCVCDLVESWGCKTFCAEHVHTLDRLGIACPDAIIFFAEDWEGVRQYAMRQTMDPILIMVGAQTPSSQRHDTSRHDASCSDASTSRHIPTYDQLGFPIRPARLRALLQILLQPQPDTQEEETTA